MIVGRLRDSGGRPAVMIAIGGLALIGVIWLAIVAFVTAERDAAIRHAEVEAANLSAAFQEEISQTLEVVSQSMDVVAGHMRTTYGTYDIHAWARDIPALSGATIHGTIVGTDGRVVSSTLAEHPQPVDLSDREHIRVQLDGGVQGIFISKPVPGRVPGQFSLDVTKRVEAADGSFLGVIVFSLSPERLTRLNRRIDFGDHGTLSVIGATDHVIRAEFGPGAMTSAIGRRVPPVLLPTDNLKPAFSIHPSVVDHELRLYCDRLVPDYNLIVSVGLGMSEILAPSLTLAQRVVAAGAVATLLLCCLIMMLLREVRQRHQRELQVRASERRLRDFAELSSDWFWEQDAEFRFTYVGAENPLLHPDSKDHIGKRRWEMNDISRSSEHWAKHIEDVSHHRPFHDFRYDRPGPDGIVRYVSVSGVPVCDDAGACIGYRGTGRDVTAEMQTEADLRQAKERAEQAETLLRDAVDSISEGFVIYDRDDRFVMCNEAYRRLYSSVADLLVPGTPYKAIVSKWFATGGYPDASGDAEQTLAMRLQQRRTAGNSIERQVKDGSWLLMIDRPMSNGGIAGLRIDISRLKQAQAALRDSEERLDRAQRIAGIGSWEFDVRTGRRVWSKEMYRIRGVLSDDEAPTIQGLEPFTHPDDRDRFYTWLEQLKAGIPQPAIEYRISLPDGEQRVVVAEGEPIFDESGVCANVAGTLRDVTQLRRTEQALLQAQKMESVGQLTGGLAHDFNNILGAVIGHIDLAESFAEPGSQLASHCQIALDAALRGADLVKRLLAFSRRQPLFPKSTNLKNVIADLLPLVERTLGENILITAQYPPDLWPAVADAVQLESAILNLIVNARDAMRDGGAVSIEASNVTISTGLATSSGELAPGDYAMISVSDTGCGMPPGVLARVFEPFFTTKALGTSSGLGLSMVFGTIRQLGGTVHIYSEVGVGTTVNLYLPRAERTAEARPAAPDGPIPTGQERILLVEDNPQIRALGDAILRELGYHVTIAETGDAGLRHVETGEDFDLLFTDIIMPGQTNGIALARELRARNPSAHVLFTSGFSSPAALRDEIHNLSSAEFIAKPYRKAQLAVVVRAMLNRAMEPV